MLFKFVDLKTNCQAIMKKPIFTLALFLLLGFSFTAISCKNEPKTEDSLLEEMIKDPENSELKELDKDLQKDQKSKTSKITIKGADKAEKELGESVKKLGKSGDALFDVFLLDSDEDKKAVAQEEFMESLEAAYLNLQVAKEKGVGEEELTKYLIEIDRLLEDIQTITLKSLSEE